MKTDNFESLITHGLSKFTTEDAYRLGFDCGKNGANSTNCDFRIFSTPEKTKAWERGKKDSQKIKKS